MLATSALDRNKFLSILKGQKQWDVIVIGGGATGLGIAVDSASRGYSTLLLEQSDFAKGTSSRSTKLVHGGVRYLAKGDIRLVYDALHERGLLLKNASHLVKQQPFIIPCYNWLSAIKYLIGLKMYDLLSGRFSFGASKLLNRAEVLQQFPGIKAENLVAGIVYYDGKFDDARLAVNLAQTAAEKGGVLLNYCKVTGVQKQDGKISGVTAVDIETKQEYILHSKTVINATGVFVDEVLQMDKPGSKQLVRPSQGVHLVVHSSFLRSNSAIMIPKTSDGRVFFAVPWNNYVLLGTTDTAIDAHSLEPVALDKEVDFILNTIRGYMVKPPAKADVLSVFAGLRPLANPEKDTNNTKEISRDHKLIVSASNLITITGGKWTTYRRMAEQTVDKAIKVGKLPVVACSSHSIKIHGANGPLSAEDTTNYGTDYALILQLIEQEPRLAKKLLPELPYTEAEVVWATRNEMARTVEDVLARRLRLLFLDARAARSVAPRVAALMAAELGYDENWQQQQVEAFGKLSSHYLLHV